jgi:hypothetical protein
LKEETMRYLTLLAAVMISAPACATEAFTHRIELLPGFATRWEAPAPFSKVVVGSDAVEVTPGETNTQIFITKKPDGGTTNIVLNDANGNLVANLLVAENHYWPARSVSPLAVSSRLGTTGMVLYRQDPDCGPDCFKVPPKKDEK